MSTRSFFLAALTIISVGRAEVVIEPVAGQSTVVVEYEGATDFSGLTWLGGENYYAVSDKVRAMFPMKIVVEKATGRIASARFGAPIPVKTDYSDFEGIAWQADTERLYLSSESENGIVGFSYDGASRFAVKVPEMFDQARKNKSLESLTFGAKAFWTANEDALKGDGETSSAEAGALVRVQKFDAGFRPQAQYAYRTEPSLFRVDHSGTGVSDLCALPDGELLVLERVVGLGLSVKIFRVDFSAATDTSKIGSLAKEKVVPGRKKLVFERATGLNNFEGIALGPELAGGWRSLILIADSGGGTKHLLMPLRVKWGGGSAQH